MRVINTKVAVDPFTIVSVNEDLKIEYKENGPGILLEDQSILIFYNVTEYTDFMLNSGIYDVDNSKINMSKLEETMYKEDDLPINKYYYYNHAMSAVALYNFNKINIIRIFRENL